MTTHRPWRYREASTLRGFILGSMFGGWLNVIVGVTLAVVGRGVLSFTAVAVAIALLATYMWYHG